MEKIKITRENEWPNWTRDFRIYIDGEIIGSISDGETKDFYVPTGQHKLRANLYWSYGSEDFDFTLYEKNNLSVTISSSKRRVYVQTAIGFTLSLIYLIQYAFDLKYINLLTIPLLPMLIYSLIIGRKKSIEIKEN